eukprot:2186329-Prymnesium_polylepis.1
MPSENGTRTGHVAPAQAATASVYFVSPYCDRVSAPVAARGVRGPARTPPRHARVATSVARGCQEAVGGV